MYMSERERDHLPLLLGQPPVSRELLLRHLPWPRERPAHARTHARARHGLNQAPAGRRTGRETRGPPGADRRGGRQARGPTGAGADRRGARPGPTGAGAGLSDSGGGTQWDACGQAVVKPSSNRGQFDRDEIVVKPWSNRGQTVVKPWSNRGRVGTVRGGRARARGGRRGGVRGAAVGYKMHTQHKIMTIKLLSPHCSRAASSARGPARARNISCYIILYYIILYYLTTILYNIILCI
jgi:hypothetical protein